MMKKCFTLLLTIVLLFTVVGCGGTETENIDGTVENSEAQVPDETSDETTNGDSLAINQEIANDDEFGATLVDIKKISDDIWGNSIEITFELENKTDQTVEVQAREVSVDGKMVDDGTLTMSQEISAGKKADGVLTITEFEGKELPKMEDNLEMILHVFSWDDMDYEKDYPVNITLN